MRENGFILDVLTLEEAAKYLKLSTKEVRTLGPQGRIPCQIVGRKYRFLKAALIGMVAKSECQQDRLGTIWRLCGR